MGWLPRLIWSTLKVIAAMFRQATLYDQLRFIRLALSGAIAGVAIFGVLGLILGIPGRELYDLVGAAAGFLAVVCAKASHFV